MEGRPQLTPGVFSCADGLVRRTFTQAHVIFLRMAPTAARYSPQKALNRLSKYHLRQSSRKPKGKSIRVYFDDRGSTYHSVTHIIGETSDKEGLAWWEKKHGPQQAGFLRNLAATRGTSAHSYAEYLLKTTQKISHAAAHQKRLGRYNDNNGLLEVPSGIHKWAMEHAHASLPEYKLHSQPYAVPLVNWILNNVSQVYSVEFRAQYKFPSIIPGTPCGLPFDGFAGQADALLALHPTEGDPDSPEALSVNSQSAQRGVHKGGGGSPPKKAIIVDWKTSQKPCSPEKILRYMDQLGAYSLALQQSSGIIAEGACIVVSRYLTEPEVVRLNHDELNMARDRFLARCSLYAQMCSD